MSTELVSGADALRRRDDLAPDGPVVQSVAIGFRALYVAVLLMAAVWLASNVRQVPPDQQALVLRFGRIVAAQSAGLVIAWPRPIEDVVLLPSADRQLSLPVAGTRTSAGLEDFYTKASGADLPRDASAFLTGDGGVVLLSATLYYQVTDAAAYFLGGAHVAPALQRLFQASALDLAAGRDLDDFLVARPDRAATGRTGAVQALREAIRGDLVARINRRLADLAARGGTLGVSVSRVDLQSTLPPSAKLAFDQVLNAVQMADQSIAASRTDAARILQEGDRERDRVLNGASATAAETVGRAQSQTASVVALHARMQPETRAGLLDQVYRDQLAGVIRSAGQVSTVDPRGGARLILPGSKP